MKREEITWSKIVAKYRTSSVSKSWWQIANSLVPFLLLFVVMVYTVSISPWITVGLSVLASGFILRLFIIFHDCCHGSFFESKKLNNTIGFLLSVLFITPYSKWRFEHLIHHGTAGNLDNRGTGDIDTITVEEYLSLSKWGKMKYRIYRNPIFLFFIAPFFLFVFKNKFSTAKMSKKEKARLRWNNAYIILTLGLVIWLIGWRTFLWIEIPLIYFSSSIGVWLFYLQHQYEDVTWSRRGEWDLSIVALEGSSFFKLPRLLQWFSGNIGFHHIHHLDPKIPNYNLQDCHYENEEFQSIKPLTFWKSFKTWGLSLWDEKNKKLIKFKAIRN